MSAELVCTNSLTEPIVEENVIAKEDSTDKVDNPVGPNDVEGSDRNEVIENKMMQLLTPMQMNGPH